MLLLQALNESARAPAALARIKSVSDYPFIVNALGAKEWVDHLHPHQQHSQHHAHHHQQQSHSHSQQHSQSHSQQHSQHQQQRQHRHSTAIYISNNFTGVDRIDITAHTGAPRVVLTGLATVASVSIEEKELATTATASSEEWYFNPINE
jgi:hypothetical protein